MNGRCLKLSANIAALAIFTFAVWRVGSMITPEKIVASCNSPSRVADELNDAVRLVRENVGPAESLVFHVDEFGWNVLHGRWRESRRMVEGSFRQQCVRPRRRLHGDGER